MYIGGSRKKCILFITMPHTFHDIIPANMFLNSFRVHRALFPPFFARLKRGRLNFNSRSATLNIRITKWIVELRVCFSDDALLKITLNSFSIHFQNDRKQNS